MQSPTSPQGNCTDPEITPNSVRVVRALGQGRAARAQLVETVMPDGRTVQCVEKVFAPGLLTRAIYRCSFQSPFAYQSNRDAIVACYYRRRVAAGVLAASDIEASIAEPLYVRYDRDARAWVLAAKWIDGRGIRPADADASRLRRWLLRKEPPARADEVDALVETMHQLESMLGDCGLVGSGWQVAPRALVSTANLLRVGNQYTIVDLESGIPAVLVPRYLINGAARAALPPFDDLDADRLRNWIDQNEIMLKFRIGQDAVRRLRSDIELLIESSSRWKNSELALFRRPWRLLTRRGTSAYHRECFRRWNQDRVVDAATFDALGQTPLKARMIWYAGLLPAGLGTLSSRIIGRRDYRDRLIDCLRSREARAETWKGFLDRCQTKWSKSGRIAPGTRVSMFNFAAHAGLSHCTPARVHRFIVDPHRRRDASTKLLLLVLSARYQSWFGQNRVEASIESWSGRKRISGHDAESLREDLCGNEVRVYTRGFGMHLALKALAPVIAPAKVGGVAAFLAGGNLWFLLPLLLTPLLRTAVTLLNWWTTRDQHVPHGEVLVMGLLPIVGSLAFPMQMFATRPRLSTFLIRDAASKLGQRVPVYGGSDSRTEIALIRASDFVIEFMQLMSQLSQRISPLVTSSTRRDTLPINGKTRVGKWIDRLAISHIESARETSHEKRSRTAA